MHFNNGVDIRQICNASLRSEIELPATCLYRGFEDLVQLFMIIKRKQSRNSNSCACCKSTQCSVNYLSRQNYLHLGLRRNLAHQTSAINLYWHYNTKTYA